MNWDVMSRDAFAAIGQLIFALGAIAALSGLARQKWQNTRESNAITCEAFNGLSSRALFA